MRSSEPSAPRETALARVLAFLLRHLGGIAGGILGLAAGPIGVLVGAAAGILIDSLRAERASRNSLFQTTEASADGQPTAAVPGPAAQDEPSADYLAACRLLGVAPSSGRAEIRRVYRELALLYHPDQLANLDAERRAQAEEAFKRISEAYERVIARKR